MMKYTTEIKTLLKTESDLLFWETTRDVIIGIYDTNIKFCLV